MKIPNALIALALVIAFSGVSSASEYEPDDGTQGHVPAVAHEVFILAPQEAIDPRIIDADLDFTAEMKRHHEGP